MRPQHRLLSRQIRRCLKDVAIAGGLKEFIDAVNEAYWESDEDRAMLESSLELSSRELFQANTEMRAVFEALPDLIIHMDLDGTILNVSGGDDWNLPKDLTELIGSNVRDYAYPDFMGRFVDALESLRRAKSLVFFEFSFSNKRGETKHFETRVIPVLDQAIAVTRNITERKSFEQKLMDAYQQTEILLTSISSILIGVDADDCVTRWNAAAEAAFGLESSEVLGREFIKSGIQWNWHDMNARIAAVREKSLPTRLEDIKFVGKDGKECFLAVTINPMPHETNKPRTGYVLLATDITERKIMENQLTQAQKLEAIGQLAAGIAHEINTPIQYVGDNSLFLKESFSGVVNIVRELQELLSVSRESGYATDLVSEIDTLIDALDLDYLVEEIPQAIQQSIEGVDRVAEIVRAMKEFSHPGTREKKSIDINSAILNTITVARNEWKYVADVSTDLQKDLPRVLCLPDVFNQVILNLIVNAAHAIADVVKDTAAKGQISLATRQKDQWIEISVADTGAGIPENIRDKIFEPFFTTKEVGKGTGQGLAIAHDVIVNKHNGTITFESEVGKGTTFFIQLPLDPSLLAV